eukprot:tig00000055_g20102.t1
MWKKGRGSLTGPGRWRRVVEETEWAVVELRIKGGTAIDSKIRAAEFGESSSSSSSPTRSLFSELFEKTKLRPREVTIERLKGEDGDQIVGDPDVNANLISAYLLGVLRALRPPEGAASSLEGLRVGFCFCLDLDRFPSRDIGNRIKLPWPRAPELRAALAPFGALRSLALDVMISGVHKSLAFQFSGLDEGISPHAAAAIAAACPLLRSLSLPLRPSGSPTSTSAVLAALAPLAHLQQLAVVLDGVRSGAKVNVAAGLAALADGPAGKSLRKIAFFKAGVATFDFGALQILGDLPVEVEVNVHLRLADDFVADLFARPGADTGAGADLNDEELEELEEYEEYREAWIECAGAIRDALAGRKSTVTSEIDFHDLSVN